MKNIRLRQDGRYEWRKQINGINYQKINKNKKELEKQVRILLKGQKETLKITQTSNTFINIAWNWYNLYKKNIKSHDKYENYIKSKFETNKMFNQDINKITYAELEYFINSITEHRVASYCYFIIVGVYKEAFKLDYVKKDISKLITKPKNKTIKGNQFTIKEQKLILDNLDKTEIKHEILFYLLTGCRRSEAFNYSIQEETSNIFINGTKTENSKRFVPISSKYLNILKENRSIMFKFKERYYNRKFKQFLDLLNIKGKSIHSLRHTYSTNLYYLGVSDKQRQLYLGHSSIVITNDIYTHLEPNVKKEDILNLYKDLYPIF